MIDAMNLSFSYDQTSPGLQIKDVSFRLSPGTVTGLIGPNGSGKSTLLSLLVGYLTPRAGQILLEGRDIGIYTRRELGRLAGYVSQSARYPFNLTVGEYVLLGRAADKNGWQLPGKDDRTAAAEALALAGIECLASKGIQELSAGEQQLTAIARSLCQSPRILLLDEPVSHLDPAHASRIYSLLDALKDRGMTILMSLHQSAGLGSVCDHVIMLKEGKLLRSGPVRSVVSASHMEELYGQPFREYLPSDGQSGEPVLLPVPNQLPEE